MAERLTAMKVSLHDLSENPYVVKEGTTPNHVRTAYGVVSRANIIAAVVDKPTKTSILLDDGTARIEARAFDTDALFENIMVGDVILLIGRPREYQHRRYVVAEIAKRLGSPRWLAFRKAELKRLHEQGEQRKQEEQEKQGEQERVWEETKQDGQKKADEDVSETAAEEQKGLENPLPTDVLENKADKILSLIKRIDTGDGAAIEEVLTQSGDVTAESVLTDLMAEGEIFEVKPGRVKVLE